MRLSDRDIIAAIDNREIQLLPAVDQRAISGVTIDLHLGNKFRVFSSHATPFIDLSGDGEQISSAMEKVMSDEIHIADEKNFVLHPGELALGVTFESVSLAANMVGWLDGRSSLARLGLMVHVTAHRIDPGFSGNIVLEFYNSGKLPLGLKPKMAIGAISFERLSSTALRPYSKRKDAKYKDQSGPDASRISRDN